MLGPWIEPSSMNNKKLNIYYFNTAMPIMTKFFTADCHHEWAFLGGLTICPNKSKMADGDHIEFHKMLISPY